MRNIKIILVLLLTVVLFTACSGAKTNDAKLDALFLEKAHEAVKEAFGTDYIPSMAYEKEMLQTVLGVNLEDVDAYVAEGPMMMLNVDTFVGIRAKEGKGEAVTAALETYRKMLVEDSMQYPMNIAKVNAATVYTIDDHVFFIMLGKMNEAVDQTEEEALAYEKAQVQIAIDAIEALLK